ncbi:MAG TPA: glutathione S-transferase family protein [Polyangiaceae bacterium]|jgi:glutathione S-transferase
MFTLYDYLPSGNGYKCRLALHQLEKPFRRVDKDIVAGASRTPEFLAKNPNGRIPLLELEDGRVLSESNAILSYVAEGSHLVPKDPFERALVNQWLFYEQYSHEPNVATARFWIHYVKDYDRAALAKKQEQGRYALALMDRHLEGKTFFVGERYSIADIALYAYTHVAEEGGFDLSLYGNVRRWLGEVASQARHVPITFRDFAG